MTADAARIRPGMGRRAFLGRGVSALAGVTILPRSVFGANGKIDVAFIGAGGKGSSAVKAMAGNPAANIVAFADVDEKRAGATYQGFPGVPTFADFRKMMDKHGKGIDAVVISTPDHTHHYCGKWCMRMGKHVYIEKPLAHNIAQIRDLMEAEKKNKLVCQMGNQGHSGVGIPLLDAWAKAGVFGEVKELRAWCKSNWSFDDAERPKAEPVPPGLDWDLWLGPAPQIPHSTRYYPSRWRGWFDFGNGALGDWACHNMDAPWTVFDLGYPSKVHVESTGPLKLSFPKSARLTYTFPAKPGRGEMVLRWYQGPEFQPERPAELEPDRQMGNEGGGSLIIGSKATAVMGSHAGTPRIIPESKAQEMAATLPKVAEKRSSHFDNWLRAIRGEEKARSHFAYAGLLTEVMQLGNIALHLNCNLKLDPVSREILDNPEAKKMFSWPPPRKGWEA
ncbi:MAG TPA: Gfo/Idh/MocA family oxidoreductase [Verrucomicrobiae bacterium]|nr:Gfo/Idh/MocA family oxidoreductase [Verrucomicrobiae bacterium]